MLDDLNELNTFQRILTLGSLSAAARDLGVSLAVVSKRLASLERRAGHRLIRRTTRRLAPTEDGAALLPHIDRIFEAIRGAEARLRQDADEPVGLLRVSAPTALGRLKIVPLMAKLAEAHPQLSFELLLGESLIDLFEARIDVAVRVGPAKDSSYVMHKLADSQRILVAAPEYLRQMGRPRAPRDLEHHAILRMLGWSAPWILTGPAGETTTIDLPSRMKSDNGEAVHDWALDGHGIMLKSSIDVSEDLKLGRLERVLPDWQSVEAPIYALMPTAAFVPAKARRFINELKNALRPAAL